MHVHSIQWDSEGGALLLLDAERFCVCFISLPPEHADPHSAEQGMGEQGMGELWGNMPLSRGALNAEEEAMLKIASSCSRMEGDRDEVQVGVAA
jgi:hypothetical protein